MLWICFALKKNLQTEKAKNEEMQKRVRGNTLAYGVEIQVGICASRAYLSLFNVIYHRHDAHVLDSKAFILLCVCVYSSKCALYQATGHHWRIEFRNRHS